MSIYQHHDICLTTKHQKQKAIGPVFYTELIANIVTCELDTDTLGTFSGEVPRTLNAIEAARQKCLWGMRETDSYLGLASEGSFGPHPVMHFLPSNHEILYFIDKKLDFHVCEKITTTKTNYQLKIVDSIDELIEYAKRAQYPSHGLIIRPNITKQDPIIYKGITTDSLLLEAFEKSMACSSDHRVRVETDMRAHMNPSRMSVITELSIKLAKRLKQLCKNCGTPGWGITRVEKGLECALCGLATEAIKYEFLTCTKCDFEEKVPRSDGLRNAAPANCENCNP